MKEKKQRALCICASNSINSGEKGNSGYLCRAAAEAFQKKEIEVEMLDLQESALTLCRGCGGCAKERRCAGDEDFNRIYRKITEADHLFFLSPYHAPVPAALCALLEKMLWLSGSGRRPGRSLQAALCGKLAGIISWGEGGERMLMHCKTMVNDVIADALEACGIKVVPFNSKWNTGLSFVSECDCGQMEEQVDMYVEIMVQTLRTLYAIL